MRTRRSDGRRAVGVPAYRRMIPFLMRRRNESVVYFEQTIDLSRTLPWLAARNRADGADTDSDRVTLFHLILHAIARVLSERPRLNRFVAGRRIYQRDDIWLSFAAKPRMDDDAPLVMVKRRFDPAQSLSELARSLSDDIRAVRSPPSAHAAQNQAHAAQRIIDRELAVLLRLPAPVLAGAMRVFRALDAWGLAPRAMLGADPMYASAVVANLGSLGIDAAYHHLYEHGTCALFVTIGRIARSPVVAADDTVQARDTVTLRFSFDERIEDGLYCARSLELLRTYLEDPASHLAA